MKKSVYFFPKSWYTIKNRCIQPPPRGLNRAQVHRKNDQGADGAKRSAEQGGARGTDAVVCVRPFPRGMDKMLSHF